MIGTRRLGIRARSTIGATIALALALVIGGLILRSQLLVAMTRSIEDQTLTRAHGVANLVATGDYTSVLDSPGPAPGWVQVVDAEGRVIASTANVHQLTVAFAPVPSGSRSSSRRLSGLPIDSGEPVAVATVAVAVTSDASGLTVIAASPLDIADETDRRVIVSLLVVFPLLLLFGATTVWAVLRRAFGPVEAIRTQVASISTSDLSQRVPEPRTNDEIDRLARTMNEMLERLDASVTRQRRFVGDASHELRSPLASLRNQLEVSTLDNRDPEWADTVAGMITDHERIERLLQDLLLLARHDDQSPMTTEAVDLGYLVRTALARRPPLDRIKRTIQTANVLVLGDPSALERILRNLVDNAERHANHSVLVRVEPSNGPAGPTGVLSVEDDGPGIPDHQRVAVFERFRRLDDARAADAGGSGLGLAIVADLVHAHHGTVRVEAGAVGARFVVALPALQV